MKDNNASKETILCAMEELKSYLDRILETAGDDIDDYSIICKQYRGKNRLYLVDKEGKETYLSSLKTAEIRTYAQKRYRREIRRVAEREKEQLDKSMRALNGPKNVLSDINSVYDSLPEALKPFVEPEPLSDEAYAREWQQGNTIVKSKNLHKQDDYHKYKTIRGDYVGSKIEAIIADRLLANGIPYHYEAAFIPEAEVDKSRPVFDIHGRIVGFEAPFFDPRSQDTLHPDFYVLNKRTRKAYFWEHLGKTDNPDYCKTNLNRLLRFVNAGYTIGEDVIVTHEDSHNPLRLESIDELIEKFLK